MYKKLYVPVRTTNFEPLPTKGSFLSCVPERDLMLTNHVYDIQLKNRKTTDHALQ